MPRKHLFLLLAVTAPCVAAGPDVLAFVQTNCLACHSAAVRSGDIDLEVYKDAKAFTDGRETWERVLGKLKAGEMPPPGIPRPPAAEFDAVTRWLEAEFKRQDLAIRPEAGPVPARRLNRAEYNNTVRDLLGVDLRPADNFPQDNAAFGFDNNGDALRVSPVLLDKYLDAAERVVRTAIFGPEKMKPAMTHYGSPVRIQTVPKSFDNYDLTGLSALSSFHVSHRFPVEAEYNFHLVLNGHRPNQSEPAHLGFWVDGKLIHEFDIDATDLEGQTHDFRARITAGDHLLSASYIKQFHGLPPSYKGPEPSTRPPQALVTTRGALTEKDLETLRKLGTTIKLDRVETRVDNRFEAIDIGGPFDQVTKPSPENLRRIFVCKPVSKDDMNCARSIVANFATRAFRRAATRAEVDQFLNLVSLARKQGDSFEEGIAAALEAVLVAPPFLFRMEKDRPATSEHQSIPVGDYELASRLSYFLWSTMPDAELIRAASAGQLRRPGVLAAQVRRMLKDPKSDGLVENFAGQWLQLKNMNVVKPDPERFPEFDESLRQSMRRETELFFANIIREDRSVLDFLNADYTFLNERLARFYGVPGVTGPEFRKVDMTGTRRGGGLLAQSSVLTVSSYATRTSPVLRGKWVLENILNAPPPPPPPNVPALDDTKIGASMTIRQQMEAHRANPVCASCHARMDPLGFGLENLNAIGAWRDVDGKFPIDPSGSLPGGKTFQGPGELKAILKAQPDAFVQSLTEKMLTYALGRGIERYDKPVLSAIQAKMKSDDYRFSDLILGIVTSVPFQTREGIVAVRAAKPATVASTGSAAAGAAATLNTGAVRQ
jgi:hypothetical protein